MSDEPPLTIQAYHVSSGFNLPATRIVVHVTNPGTPGTPSYVPYPLASAARMAAGTARFFTDPASGGSAHYVEDVGGEQHCVAETAIAWHAPPNRGSIGIEICGQDGYTRDQWLATDVWPAVARAASRVADVCARRGIPTVRLSAADLKAGRYGICGHVDVSQAFHQSDHTDPGPNFPWDAFMAAVNGSQPAPAPAPAPVVTNYPEEQVQTIDTQTNPLDDQGNGYLDEGIDPHKVFSVVFNVGNPPDDHGYPSVPPRWGRRMQDGQTRIVFYGGTPHANFGCTIWSMS